MGDIDKLSQVYGKCVEVLQALHAISWLNTLTSYALLLLNLLDLHQELNHLFFGLICCGLTVRRTPSFLNHFSELLLEVYQLAQVAVFGILQIDLIKLKRLCFFNLITFLFTLGCARRGRFLLDNEWDHFGNLVLSSDWDREHVNRFAYSNKFGCLFLILLDLALIISGGRLLIWHVEVTIKLCHCSRWLAILACFIR